MLEHHCRNHEVGEIAGKWINEIEQLAVRQERNDEDTYDSGNCDDGVALRSVLTKRLSDCPKIRGNRRVNTQQKDDCEDYSDGGGHVVSNESQGGDILVIDDIDIGQLRQSHARSSQGQGQTADARADNCFFSR